MYLSFCVTNKTFKQGFELLPLSGLRYASCLTKSSAEEVPYDLSSTEHILLGVRGNLELLRNHALTELA